METGIDMSEFLTNEAGVYLASLVFGIGLGLLIKAESRRAWVGFVLVFVVFLALIWPYLTRAVWAGPLFVVALGVTALLSAAAEHGSSPLAVGEPYWRKVLLLFIHGRKVSAAARSERQEELQGASALRNGTADTPS